VTSALGGSYANVAGNISGATATMNTGGVNATLTVLELPTIAARLRSIRSARAESPRSPSRSPT
jgi:hypothetical protein